MVAYLIDQIAIFLFQAISSCAHQVPQLPDIIMLSITYEQFMDNLLNKYKSWR
jgi:hypothetical protein